METKNKKTKDKKQNSKSKVWRERRSLSYDNDSYQVLQEPPSLSPILTGQINFFFVETNPS